MKQRIVIANSLLLNPSILIADEPTTALDVITQSQIISLLKNMKDSKKMKIVLITHDLSLIPNVVERVIIMYAGQAVETSDTKTIFSSPLHPYTQALIKSIPSIKSTRKTIQFIPGDQPNLLNIKEGCRFRDRCPHALDICESDPPDIIIEGNQVKCWLYDNKTKSKT
jgi:peptide/nickel transport system ATP-binding protein